MTWALWLALPVVVTIVAAVWSWLRGRPAKTPKTAQAIQLHADYLDALVQTPRCKDRGHYVEPME